MFFNGFKKIVSRCFLANALPSFIRKRALNGIAFGTIFLITLVPFFTPPFSATFSGDFGGAFQPFSVEEMESIKQVLQNISMDEKIICFPRMDYRTVSINNHTFLFTDEFYNLFFEVPAIEGVSGTSLTNRFYVSLGYHLLYNNMSYVNRLFALQGVKYIFFHNDTTEDRIVNETKNILPHQQPRVKQQSYFMIHSTRHGSLYRNLILNPLMPWFLILSMVRLHGVFLQTSAKL
jgi:hypothetical protein